MIFWGVMKRIVTPLVAGMQKRVQEELGDGGRSGHRVPFPKGFQGDDLHPAPINVLPRLLQVDLLKKS